MSVSLPDVALTEQSVTHIPLDWVGMQGIVVPVLLDELGVLYHVQAEAAVQVNLPDPQIKGIHMSRLYRLLNEFAEQEKLAPSSMAGLLQRMASSHADCHSSQARLTLDFNILCKRPALLTEGLSGWKAYPVKLEAIWDAGSLQLHATVMVGYSSTCPCSAALSRQLIEQAFKEAFGETHAIEPLRIAAWLQQNATLATPHSQRSVAQVRVLIPASAQHLNLLTLIDTVEAALGTPLQTAVKRADEQAFARLNGQNLMYVEDAARRVQQAISQHYPQSSVGVSHVESLHPHDAVASVSSAKDSGKSITAFL
ncbi:GTP cyclohydrolase FolE2 [Halopseudomonas pelagia]|uniref:GTP cyclohydrolase FolE2 n=1 Tax=Halopseudomonas pelagia TaxID=553151 RepID=UPI00048C6329|nr:GTP cyclohydrolase FolE2 [Halopseudomonas pelagia]